jgi:hypothetical protein
MTDPDLFLFVSHVNEDRRAALEIVDELEQRGVPCWIAPRDVRPGRPFDDEIVAAIESCRAMLLVFSEHCNEHEYIRREVTVAGESHKVIIPFRIQNAQPRRGLRVRLSDLHWIDGFVSRERGIDQVVKTIDPERARWQQEERRRDEEGPGADEQRRGQEEEQYRQQQKAEQRRQQAEERRFRQQKAEEERLRLRTEDQRRKQHPQPPQPRPFPDWVGEGLPRIQRAFGRRSIAIASAAAAIVVFIVVLALSGVFTAPTDQQATSGPKPAQATPERSDGSAIDVTDSNNTTFDSALPIEVGKIYRSRFLLKLRLSDDSSRYFEIRQVDGKRDLTIELSLVRPDTEVRPNLAIYDMDRTKLFSRYYESSDGGTIKWTAPVTPGNYVVEIKPTRPWGDDADFRFSITAD